MNRYIKRLRFKKYSQNLKKLFKYKSLEVWKRRSLLKGVKRLVPIVRIMCLALPGNLATSTILFVPSSWNK